MVLDEQTTLLVSLTVKLYGIKWSGKLNDLLEYLSGTAQECKNQVIKPSETELTNLLLRAQPKGFVIFSALLPRVAVKDQV